MKKLNYITLLFIATLIIGLFSCESKLNPTIANENSNKLQFNSFMKYGTMHNSFLTNIKNNFKPDDTIKTLPGGIDYINEFNKTHIKQLKLSQIEKNALQKQLDKSKIFVVKNNFYKMLFSNSQVLVKTTSDSTILSIFQIIEYARLNNLIDDFEYNSLNDLSNKIKENYEGNLTDNGLLNYINNLKSDWEKQSYTTNSKGGRILAITLAISISSLNWWQENEASLSFLDKTNSLKLLPAWAGADIAGAAIGAIISGTAQYSVNGDIDWGVIGVSALGGAVAGSTGIVGKVGGWISGLF